MGGESKSLARTVKRPRHNLSMIRVELRKNDDLTVRYDGTETKLHAHCWKDGETLSKREIKRLIAVLQDALIERRAFEKNLEHDRLLARGKR